MRAIQKRLTDDQISTWQSVAALPDGPVELWVIVFSDDGYIMGAARAVQQPVWLWRNGHLSINYSPVHITVQRDGRYATGLIGAVSPPDKVFQPIWPISLGPPQELKRYDTITIIDGIIALIPDLPGPHG